MALYLKILLRRSSAGCHPSSYRTPFSTPHILFIQSHFETVTHSALSSHNSGWPVPIRTRARARGIERESDQSPNPAFGDLICSHGACFELLCTRGIYFMLLYRELCSYRRGMHVYSCSHITRDRYPFSSFCFIYFFKWWFGFSSRRNPFSTGPVRVRFNYFDCH